MYRVKYRGKNGYAVHGRDAPRDAETATDAAAKTEAGA